MNYTRETTIEQAVVETTKSEDISDVALDRAPQSQACRQTNSLGPTMRSEIERH
jgi:hypothetical protein